MPPLLFELLSEEDRRRVKRLAIAIAKTFGRAEPRVVVAALVAALGGVMRAAGMTAVMPIVVEALSYLLAGEMRPVEKKENP